MLQTKSSSLSTDSHIGSFKSIFLVALNILNHSVSVSSDVKIMTGRKPDHGFHFVHARV